MSAIEIQNRHDEFGSNEYRDRYFHRHKPSVFSLSTVVLFSEPKLHWFVQSPHCPPSAVVFPNNDPVRLRKIRTNDLNA